MRLLIVAVLGLFLIFSTACASPMYVKARGKSITPDGLKGLLMNTKLSRALVIATLGTLWEVNFQGTTYQVLALTATNDPRNFAVERQRFVEKKIQLDHHEIGKFHYFTFNTGTFSAVAPKGMVNFDEIREGAGKAYAEAGWDSKMIPMNKNPENYFYESVAEGGIGVYVGPRHVLNDHSTMGSGGVNDSESD